MNTSADRFAQIQPQLLRRLSGGWLAVSQPGAFLSIGVEGDTGEEAEERFRAAVEAWRQLLCTDDL